MTTTKKQWTAAYNELAESSENFDAQANKSFKTAAAAEEAFKELASQLGISWTVALEGDIVLEEPGADDTTIVPDWGDAPAIDDPDTSTPPAPAEQQPEGAGEEKPAGRRAREADTDVIAVLVPNPKRPNSLSFARFAIYTTGITVAEFLAKGGRRADLKWDADHEFIRIHSVEDWVATCETPSDEQEETASADVPADA